MQKSAKRLFTALFLLTLFLGSKGLEFHVLSHGQDNDQVTCEWCDYALVLQTTPLEPATVSHLDIIPTAPAQNQILTCCLSNPQDRLAWEPLFGRPPPTI